MKELIIKNGAISELLFNLIEVTSELLDLPVGYKVKYESEQEEYEIFDQIYAYLGYELEINQNTLNELGINGTSDLIEFYEVCSDLY